MCLYWLKIYVDGQPGFPSSLGVRSSSNPQSGGLGQITCDSVLLS